MLLPDNINPQLSIYYIASFVLKELQNKEPQDIIELYYNIKSEYGLSFSIFLLCLDWLYLIGVAEVDAEGEVNYVSKNIKDIIKG